MDLHRFQELQPGCTLRSRNVTLDERGGLQTHLIEAFPASASEPVTFPLILLLHGFPELAYSWRKVLGPLSVAHEGYHVVAPDLRGYGRTVAEPGETPTQIQYDDPIAPFHVLNVVEDICSLVKALGHDLVATVVGHDFGSFVAGHCVIAHPELFCSVVFMSVPFTGVERPRLPIHVDPADEASPQPPMTFAQAVSMSLGALTPPKKHYTAYFSTRDANRDMLGEGEEDIYNFLGAYYHMKSGAWEGNTIYPLPSAANPSRTVDEATRGLAMLPEYYIMPADENMRQVVERHASQDPHFTWPPDEIDAARVYASEFARTGFQGGLNYYRSMLSPPPPERVEELIVLWGRRVHAPAAFLSGERDWGVYQVPGALEKMKHSFNMENEHMVLIRGAGHWVQQEAPDHVVDEILRFLDYVAT